VSDTSVMQETLHKFTPRISRLQAWNQNELFVRNRGTKKLFLNNIYNQILSDPPYSVIIVLIYL